MKEPVDVLIIGAGQQGLALGALVKKQERSLMILEAEKELGARWRAHYDSLTLFTPRCFSALPGLPFEGQAGACPTKDEFADYLGRYAKHFELPLIMGAKVTKLTKDTSFFTAETSQGSYYGKQVVIAAGYSSPRIPPFVPEHIPNVFSLHSAMYKNPRQIPPGRVLVVGNGNSAAQIAVELSSSHDVEIAMHHVPFAIPRRILGKSFYWWGEHLGFHYIPSDSWFRKLVRRGPDPVVGRDLHRALAVGTIARRPGVAAVEGSAIVFDDGSKAEYESVIWATGFKNNLSWIHIPGAVDENGAPVHRRGISPVQGLFFAGLQDQITSVSSNIYGAAHISKYLAKHL